MGIRIVVHTAITMSLAGGVYIDIIMGMRIVVYYSYYYELGRRVYIDIIMGMRIVVYYSYYYELCRRGLYRHYYEHENSGLLQLLL
jgi:hypothetical protein